MVPFYLPFCCSCLGFLPSRYLLSIDRQSILGGVEGKMSFDTSILPVLI